MATAKSVAAKTTTARKGSGKKVASTKAVAKKQPVKKVAAKTTPTARGRAQDRRLVAGQQKHEVAYEAKKEKVSPGIVQEVVKAVGNARHKVEATIQSFVKERKPPVRKKKL